MNIVAGTAPFNRSKRSTQQIMVELLIGLAVIFAAAVIFNFTIGVSYGLKVIFMMLVALVSTLLSDVIAASLRYKKAKDGNFVDYLFAFVKDNFSIITGVIFVLTLPVGTPYYVVILGSIFATLIVKHVFGGFGHNIFNPAALGRIFVTLTFPASLTTFLGTDGTLPGITSGPSITTEFANGGSSKWLNGIFDFSRFSMFDVYLGKYSGAIGETFTLLILLVGVVLAIRSVINWRTPVFFFGTVIITTFFIALANGINIGQYILLNIGLGGLAFGAIFMFTDPVTSPTSNFGKALIGIFGALLNLLFRIGGNMPEGTIFSIALINFLSPMIDNLIGGRTNVKIWKPYVVSGASLLVTVGLLTGLSVAKYKDDEIIDPQLEVHAVYKGKSKAYFPIEGNTELSFSASANVSVDKDYKIIKLELQTPSTVNSGVEHVSAAKLAPVIAYYESIDLFDFSKMPAVTAEGSAISGGDTVAPEEKPYIIPDALFTSAAIFEAIGDAFKHVSAFEGEAKERKATPTKAFTTKVKVVVNELNKIDALFIDEATTPDRFKGSELSDLVTYYTSLTVSEFRALAVPNEDLSSGTTVGQTGSHIIPGNILTSAAVYEAISNALGGYNVYKGSAPEDNVHGKKFTLSATVAVNKDGLIKTINVENPSTTNYKPELVAEAIEHLTNSYTGMSVKDFKALTAPSVDIETGNTAEALPETAAPVFPQLAHTSFAFHAALSDALKNVLSLVGTAPEKTPAGKKFTTRVEVLLDQTSLDITSLKVTNPSTPNFFKLGQVEKLVSYYLSIDLPTFKTLPAPHIELVLESGPSVEEQKNWDHVIAGGVYTSTAIYEALTDAFSDLTLVSGVSDEYAPVANRKFTTTAYVAVSSDATLAGLKLVNPSTPNYFKNGQIDDLLAYYLTLDVAEVNALATPVFDLESGPSVEAQKEWPHVISGGIYTSIAVHEAIVRALATL